MQDALYPRSIERLIREELLPAFPGVLLVGPRGCGKSTSMTQIADSVLDLSEPGVRIAVQEDPDAVLQNQQGIVLIDEWQEAPEVLGAVKRAIDRATTKTSHRFIVTGSVRAAYQAATWPGTGRLIRVRMYGLSQAELEGDSKYNPIDAFFTEEAPTFSNSQLSRNDYLERIVAGRFPSVRGLGERHRARWFSAYVEQLVERDVAQLSTASIQSTKLRSVLKACAARSAKELKKNALAQDADVDVRTADRAVGLLEDLSVVGRVPPWHTRRLGRLTRSPKVNLLDAGMAAYLLDVNSEELGRTPDLLGQLVETFVSAELATHVETASQETRLFHLRDRDGKEVDLVLEQRGRLVGLEVKSSTKVDRSDARGLRWLRDKMGDSFHFGAILYTGKLPFRLDDRIWALPISALWSR